MRFAFAAFIAAVFTQSAGNLAAATPLKLEYCILQVADNSYQYHFTLTVDNHDGTYFDGESFNWIVFGDRLLQHSNLPDFIGDPPAPPPFDDEGFRTCSGGHNGPTLLDFGINNDFRGWVPSGIGASLVWSGQSSHYLGAGQMLWSNLGGSGVNANLELAIFMGICPIPYCPADYNHDGGIDGQDVEAFFADWEDGGFEADTNRDGGVDGQDIAAFFLAWEAGGC